jgi:hypothetical protein
MAEMPKAKGAAGGGKKAGPRGSLVDPRDTTPKLASQGIDKHLADRARKRAAFSLSGCDERAAPQPSR